MIHKRWKNAKKILCIRLDNMGDVLLTSPAIASIKNSLPDSKISLLTSRSGSTITPFLPTIDETLIFAAPWMKGSVFSKSDEIISFAKFLKNKQFDGGICFSNFSQNSLPEAMLLYLAGIPLRLGYCRENPYHLLSDWVPDYEPFETIKHGVIRQIDLLKTIGIYTKKPYIYIQIKRNDKLSIRHILANYKIDLSQPLLVVHPGASDKKRIFSLPTLGIAIRELSRTYQIVLTGVEKESNLIHFLLSYAPQAVSLCGKLTIGELIALISLSSIFIGNNSGPVHIASAVGSPVIVLYARTNPEHTPWRVPHAVFYFDPPETELSSNQILRIVSPKNPVDVITPMDIMFAVERMVQKQHIQPRNKAYV